nr:hypothetical protein Iba_chr08aCG6230 [Ipomoea batatas]
MNNHKHEGDVCVRNPECIVSIVETQHRVGHSMGFKRDKWLPCRTAADNRFCTAQRRPASMACEVQLDERVMEHRVADDAHSLSCIPRIVGIICNLLTPPTMDDADVSYGVPALGGVICVRATASVQIRIITAEPVQAVPDHFSAYNSSSFTGSSDQSRVVRAAGTECADAETQFAMRLVRDTRDHHARS